MNRPQFVLFALLGLQTFIVCAQSTENTVTEMPSPVNGGGIKLPELNALEIQGRKIYLEGKLTNGHPVTAIGAGNTRISGSQASCVSCHRHSGLGGVEGNEVIPPISGPALFGLGEPVIVQIDKRFNQSMSTPSTNYNAKTFAAAIRLGRHVSGRKLNALMPRFDLPSDQLQALEAYLRTLSVTWSPGVKENEVHLATVITPDISPERLKVFIDTLNAMVAQHNVNVVSGKRQRIRPIERLLHSRRYWKVDVWDLKGPSSTWGEQLEQRQQKNPVFAVLSGLSQDEWQPVQNFCEINKVPCWFPSVDLVPDNAEKGAYSLYFSGGVELEAKVIVNQVLSAEKKPQKIIQLVGHNALAKKSSEKIQNILGMTAIDMRIIEWSPQNHEQISDEFNKLHPQDVLISWLTKDELNDLVKVVSAPSVPIYLSSTFLGEDVPAWSKEWGSNAWLVQRLELPKIREANLWRFKDWLKNRQLPLIDEKMQSEVFFAVNSFSWMLSSMLNNLHTDYLIDRTESLLSMRDTMQVQEEIQTLMMGGGGRKPKEIKSSLEAPLVVATKPVSIDINLLTKRESTTAYPRIGLSNNQRFASKGAYIRKLTPEADYYDGINAKWIIP